MSKVVYAVLLAAFIVLSTSSMLLAEEGCDGSAIRALNDDPCGLKLTIPVEDSATACQIFCVYKNPEDPAKYCGINPSWIGGTVVEDENELKFNFDPATVIIAEVVAETYQTNTCQIAANPEYYMKGTWYIPYNVIDVIQ